MSHPIAELHYEMETAGVEHRPIPVRPRTKPETPTYKAIAISLYIDDLADLDAKVEHLKAAGVTRASRSQLIRFALGRLDMEATTQALKAAR